MGMKEYIVQAIAQETIDSFDAHSAPELIRCEDCKYWLPLNRFDHDYHPGRGQCELNCWVRDFDWFCADGERKGETEIIRCKDCKHFVAEDKPCKYHGMYIPLKSDNYCEHGERR